MNSVKKDDNSTIRTITLFHGTIAKKVDGIIENGLISPMTSASWYMTATDMGSALFHASPEPGEKAVVIEFKVEVSNQPWEGYPLLWPPYDRCEGSKWFALAEVIPSENIVQVHEISNEIYLKQKEIGFDNQLCYLDSSEAKEKFSDRKNQTDNSTEMNK